MNKIMIVDDEPRIVSVIESYLKQYGHEVITANNGKEALALIEKVKPDLIVLDIMMPEMDGYEFLQQHRLKANTPVIFLTAKISEEDQVLGLELGADDYMVKPFRPRELMARIKAVLRRSKLNEPASEILKVQDVILSRDEHSVEVNRKPINLTPSEFDLLATLMSTPGKVFSRLDLLDILQGVRYEGYERTIDIHIKNLRAKLDDDPRSPRYIQTVYGAGYRFLANGK